MFRKIKSIHVRNWFYGNICTKKCSHDIKKQKCCYDQMVEIIKGHEDYLITHKAFIWIICHKHKVCDISDELFNRSAHDFGWRKL